MKETGVLNTLSFSVWVGHGDPRILHCRLSALGRAATVFWEAAGYEGREILGLVCFCRAAWAFRNLHQFSIWVGGWSQVFLMLLLQHIAQLVSGAGQILYCDAHWILRLPSPGASVFPSVQDFLFFMLAIFDWVSRLRARGREDGAVGHGEHGKEDRWGNVQSFSSASCQDLLVHGCAQGKRGLQLGTLRSCKFLAASLGLRHCRS